MPFYFLALPAELRVEIYCYALVCSHPIDINGNTLKIHEHDDPDVQLLRTCKQIFDEGSEVFYGSNQFRFWKDAEFFHVLFALPQHSFHWLKELTMCVPFGSVSRNGKGTWWIHGYHSEPSGFPHRSGVSQCYDPNALLQEILNRIDSAPHFRKLNLILPPSYYPETEGSSEFRFGVDGGDKLYMDNDKAFDAVMRFIQNNPDISLTVTNIVEPGWWYNGSARAKLLKKLRNELGIWDQREIDMSGCEPYSADWTVSTNGTTTDPET
jgi:hypothetical protein